MKISPINDISYIDALEQLTTIWITPRQAAPALGLTQYTINVIVDQELAKYGEIVTFPFPILRVGRRVKIHRKAFIQYLKSEINPR